MGILKEVTTGLPPWAKGVLAIGIVGGIGYAIYKFSKGGKKLLTVDEAKQDVKELEQVGMKQSYMDAAYLGFADAIYAARAGNNIFGTVEDTIWNTFRKMNNDLDIAKLTKAFGSRRLSYSFQEGTLGGFINDEFDPEEIDTLNNILASKKITYRF
jgi:hypothetical protein